MYHAQKEGRLRINTYMTRRPENVKEFIRVLEEALACPANTSAAERWEYLRDPLMLILQCCFTDLWQKTGKDSGLV